MPYEITIKETREVNTTEKGVWTVVEKRPWTSEEIDKADSLYRSNLELLKKEPLKDIYGYTPAREVTANAGVEVLKQTVETLDLAAVIKAINNL